MASAWPCEGPWWSPAWSAPVVEWRWARRGRTGVMRGELGGVGWKGAEVIWGRPGEGSPSARKNSAPPPWLRSFLFFEWRPISCHPQSVALYPKTAAKTHPVADYASVPCRQLACWPRRSGIFCLIATDSQLHVSICNSVLCTQATRRQAPHTVLIGQDQS